MKRLLLLLICLSMSVGWSKPRRQYLKVLHKHTKRSLIYHHMATALNGNATLLTPAMRTALAQERNRLLRPTDEDIARFATRMDDDGTQYHEVILSIDSAMPGGQQFGPGDGHWLLRLQVDGVDAELIKVEHIRRPTPLHRSLYAHHDQWSELWIARFTRKNPAPARVELIISGGYGNDTVEWKL